MPFGFDDSDEHLLFLGIEEWLRVCELAGFDIKSWTVGKMYSAGWDLSILAQMHGEFERESLALLDKAYQKPGRKLILHDDPAFEYQETDSRGSFNICRDFTLKMKADYLLILRHQWSGILRLTDAASNVISLDLFERSDHIQAIPLDGLAFPITGSVSGKNPASSSDQIVIYGALC